MRKISFIILAGLTLLSTSCNKDYNNSDLPEGGPATFSIAPTCATEYEKLAKNGSQVITFAAVTEDVGVRNQLVASFKMGDSELVAAYNAAQSPEKQALEFPAGACKFIKNDVAVDRYNKSSRSASIQVTNTPEMLKDTRYVLPVLLESVTGADNVSTETSKVVYFVFFALGLDKGQGTKDAPYLIYDTDDLLLIDSRLVSGVTTYFKMMEDVDMKDITQFMPGNQDSPFDKAIDFDGNNHTISNFTFNQSGYYAGLVGVLNGKVRNVTFDNANVTGTKAAGVVCGYAGTGSYPAEIENVVIKNSNVTQKGGAYLGLVFGTNGVAGTFTDISSSGSVIVDSGSSFNKTKSACGGIAGSSVASTFTRCSFVGTIDGGRLCGGIVGYERTAGSSFSQCSADVTINVTKMNKISGEVVGGIVGFWQGGTMSNCWTKGTITVSDQTAGGLAGNIITSSTITDCWSSADITAGRNAGGIAARASSDVWDPDAAKCLELSSCIYWGSTINVANATDSNGSSGSIVGYTTLNNVVGNSWRRPDDSFTFVNTGNTANTPADQPDGCGDWVKGTTPQVGTGDAPEKFLFPYWGKAAAKGATISSIAKTLRWDETIWDLSGDIPALK